MISRALACTTALFVISCGGGGYNSSGGGPGGVAPAAPAGLAAIAANQQVSLAGNASAAATSYHVKRATVAGGPYTQIAAPTTSSDTDTALTNGTAYYYVVSAVNSYGESANSSEVSATPTGPSVSVHMTVDVLTNRHPISPYVYGGAFPKEAPTITDSGLTTVRWGGNASTRYNWINFDTNAAADYYFINRPMGNAPCLQASTTF